MPFISVIGSNLLTDSWEVLVTYRAQLLQGVINTLIVALIGTVAGLAIGLIVGAIRAVCSQKENSEKSAAVLIKKLINTLCGIYVEVFRGTPMMIQAMLLYYALRPVFHWSAFVASIFIISVNTGAYMAEIVRSGIQAVDRGQTEGARSLGLTSFQTMRYIVLPQAIRNCFPSIGNEFIVNIKDSCVLSCITFTELFFEARAIAGSMFQYEPPFFVAGCIYLILTLLTSRILAIVERRMNHTQSSYPASQSVENSNLLNRRGE